MNRILRNVLAVIIGFVVGRLVNMWFNVADLLLAYIPMGYAGGLLVGRTKPQAV